MELSRWCWLLSIIAVAAAKAQFSTNQASVHTGHYDQPLNQNDLHFRSNQLPFSLQHDIGTGQSVALNPFDRLDSNRLGFVHTGQHSGAGQFRTNQVGATGLRTTGQFGTRATNFGNQRFGTNNLANQHFGTSNLANQHFGTSNRANQRFGTNNLATQHFGTSNRANQHFGTSNLANQRFGTNNLATNNFRTNNRQYTTNAINTSGFDGVLTANNRNIQSTSPPRYRNDGILSQHSENDGNGHYSFSYATENGITREEEGVPVGPDSIAVRGSYSYTSPEGLEVVVRYLADENGFQVQSPNVPPMPEHSRQQVLRAEENRRLGIIPDDGSYRPGHGQGQLVDQINLRSPIHNNIRNFGSSNLNPNNRNIGVNQRNQLGVTRTLVNQPIFGSNSNVRTLQGSGNFRTNQEQYQTDNRFGQNIRQGTGNQFGSHVIGQRFLNDFNTPQFQQQTASTLGIQQRGNRNHFGKDLIKNDGKHSDIYHASSITSAASGNVASHSFKS